MLLVPTYVDDSKIPGAGKGLFAGRDILKGERVWEFRDNYDRKISENDFANLSKVQKNEVLFWGYFHNRSKNWIVSGDESKRTNHSDNPNLLPGYTDLNDLSDEGYEYAGRDIAKGEELTDNYLEYDLSAKDKLSGDLIVPEKV